MNHINDINVHNVADEDAVEGKRSLKKSEIQLVCLLVVNILFNHSLIAQALPLQIFQKLLVSFIVTGLLHTLFTNLYQG